MPHKPIGVVLAGGAGSRLGRTKGDLVVAGVALAERAAAALDPLCAGVVVSVRPACANPAPGRPAVADLPPAGRGPLAGLLAVFEATAEADLLVLACDYPYVETSLLAGLLRAARTPDDVVLAVDSAGRDHPLVALWRRRTETSVRRALEQRHHRVGDVLQRLALRRIGVLELHEAPRALTNVNRPADLD